MPRILFVQVASSTPSPAPVKRSRHAQRDFRRVLSYFFVSVTAVNTRRQREHVYPRIERVARIDSRHPHRHGDFGNGEPSGASPNEPSPCRHRRRDRSRGRRRFRRPSAWSPAASIQPGRVGTTQAGPCASAPPWATETVNLVFTANGASVTRVVDRPGRGEQPDAHAGEESQQRPPRRAFTPSRSGRTS